MGPRILIVAENASAKFGGEAALPLHYFRVLSARKMPVWLVVHERTRAELQQAYPDHAQHIHYIPDTRAHKALWAIGQRLPDRLSYITTGFLMRLLTQWEQRGLVKRLVKAHQIDVVHQPTPVSPKEPSMIFGVGAPVIIGPMNGGMNFPPAFRQMQNKGVDIGVAAGRASASWLNRLMPGKRRAALLLVANQRTKAALPPGINHDIRELVENGVDMHLWQSETAHLGAADLPHGTHARFVFVGRLVDWKGVDYLMRAFVRAASAAPMSLTIIGDGVERARIEAIARSLNVFSDSDNALGKVHFTGWQPQAVCAAILNTADSLVLPSLYECGGAVVLEAMALGLPVIASNWGGPADYLDASTGILVPVDSPASFESALEQALIRLATKKDEREAMGRRAQEKVRALFDWEVKVDHMLTLYRAVSKERH
jgi:glycosyltransferase involved in cell wall biosynthesis